VSGNAPGDRAELFALLQATQARLEGAERAERRSSLLADASAVLGESLDHRVGLGRLGPLVTRWFAHWCTIDVLEEGELQRMVCVHAEAAKQPLLDELARRFPPRLVAPHASAQVMRTGQPLRFDESDAEPASTEEHRRLWLAVGAASGLVVPIPGRNAVLGTITIGLGPGDQRYGEADLGLALALARRAAMAIENARLFLQSQEAVRLRDEFLTVASHELNTPMAALMLSLEGLGTPDPELRLDAKGTVQVARLAERQGRRLTKLIGDLLDVTRLSRGALALHREEVELTTLVREVVARYKPELARAGCEISVELTGPVVGVWDPMRLDQVVLNLLANASKFGARQPITVAVSRLDGRAILRVTDRGIGVDPAQHARIFERFERGSSHQFSGLGLGLYICRRIVESHGGTIGVDSRPGLGATFRVELPLERAES
jgi:signal transduction histidine kinase